MKINSYLLATSMLLAGLSAAVPADAASTETQRVAVASQQSGAYQNQPIGANQNQNAANTNTQSAMAPSSEQNAGGSDTESAVTVREPGSHNDGYRTFQGWWKDD